MAGARTGASVREFGRLFGVGTVAGMTDGQLLEQFSSRPGPAADLAFEALVARHGPTVFSGCRQVLRDRHEAEDAFQATFLVLARRAGAIGRRDRLGPWLYGVAVRVASKARVGVARRRKHEAKA